MYMAINPQSRRQAVSAIQTIHVSDIDWSKPEWADKGSEALVAYAAGYELEIGPSPEKKGSWDWLCKVTAEISDTPEVLDMGTASSVSGAKRGAGNPANKDMRQRAKDRPKPQVKVAPVAEPVDMPAENAVEKVEQAVAAQMAKRKRSQKAVGAEMAASKSKRSRKPKAEQPEAVAA
jgi:hypothetical protein